MKKLFVFLAASFFLPCSFALADLQINEIMYDLKTGGDDGREWVEIYNNSDVSVDLSLYRLFEADTNHKIKLIEGDAKIKARSYALIVSDPVKFKIDYLNFFGNIFDSSFSLNNNGEVLMIKDKDLNIIDQYSYKSNLGGAGDGKSLQKINGVWQGSTPTPGRENKVTYVAPTPKPVVVTKKIEVISEKEEITTPPLDSLGTPLLDQGGDGGGNSLVANTQSTTFNFPIIVFPFLLAGGAGAVYFIRKKKAVVRAGDDFKILDE